MTNHGFMNGWFGDNGDEFKLEQANALMRLPRGSVDNYYTIDGWLANNKFNMVHYCHIPDFVIKYALYGSNS